MNLHLRHIVNHSLMGRCDWPKHIPLMLYVVENKGRSENQRNHIYRNENLVHGSDLDFDNLLLN